jgi:hypothetical protein
VVKALALSEESVPAVASDQIRAHCNLAVLVGTRVDVISVACIINYGDRANFLAFAIGAEVKAMASHPRQKNCVEV